MHSSLRSGRPARPIIVKAKTITTHTVRWRRGQKKGGFLATYSMAGPICHPACNHLNIYKWTPWANIEASAGFVCLGHHHDGLMSVYVPRAIIRLSLCLSSVEL